MSELPYTELDWQPPRTLVVAVLTFRRPEDIAAALPLLAAQAQSVTRPEFVAEVLVIDNDPNRSAQESVDRFSAESSVVVRYVCEPVPGISAARNRALEEAQDRDLLVFIDDDERPTPAWLQSLVNNHAAHRSAAVVGPVISEYETEVDPWIEAGQFFVRRRLPTGTRLDVAATNNLLLDLRQVRARGLSFDAAFGIGGGGDTMFTRSLHKLGGVMVWCDEAVVVDVVPRARLTRQWVIRRAFRSGNSWSLTSLALAPRGLQLRVRLTCSANGLIRLAGGVLRYLRGVCTNSLAHRARGVRTGARGAGMLAGAWGYGYQEYRRAA